MTSYLVTALGVCALSASAQAGFFSFASDSNPDGPTFVSSGTQQILDGRSMDLSGTVRVDLLYDADEDGPAGPVILAADFEFNAAITSYVVVPLGGQFMHAWTMEGGYAFADPSGGPLLTVNFNRAVLVSWSDSATLMGTSASFQDNSDTDPSLALAISASGALAGAPTGSPEFSFSLSGLNAVTGGRVPLRGGDFGTAWKSEGSWSARTIPAPGSLVMLGAAAAAGYRRRR